MTSLHQASGIKVVDKHHSSSVDRVVSEDRFQDLWSIAKVFVFRSLLDYAKKKKNRSEEEWGDYRFIKKEDYKQHSLDLNSFFTNPDNTNRILLLKKVISATREAFFSPKARKLARGYRSTFEPTMSPVEGLKLRNQTASDFISNARVTALVEVPEFIDLEWYYEYISSAPNQ